MIALIRTHIACWTDAAARAVDSPDSTPRTYIACWLDALARAIDSKDPM